MRRYWVPSECLQSDRVLLGGETFHHICVVCRRNVGHSFEVIVDKKAYLVEIETIERKKAIARVKDVRDLPGLLGPHIHLALSLPKFTTVDNVVEKMVELGVSTVHLFHSDFSHKKPRPEAIEKKHKRWQKIIQGATQQTGRGELMELTQIKPLGVLLEENFPSDKRWGLLAYEGEGGVSMRQGLKSCSEEKDEVWIFVGGEGGFSLADLEKFKDYKLLPVSLGDQVLRVETACVTLVSILKYGLGQYD